MSFLTDLQTQEDLNLLGKFKKNSIFTLFNRTQTDGGEKLLHTLFAAPLTSDVEINRRTEIFRHFTQKSFQFPFDLSDLQQALAYVNSAAGQSRLSTCTRAIRRKAMYAIGLKQEETLVINGIISLIRILQQLLAFISEYKRDAPVHMMVDPIWTDDWIQENPAITKLLTLKQDALQQQTITFFKEVQYDYQLRGRWTAAIQRAFQLIYHIDVYISVAQTANDQSFAFAHALPADESTMDLEDVFHPGIPNAIGNDLHMHQDQNLVFLTGANMAGKSTYMKSFGIAVYLAHMGFPVPARSMTFSVKQGIFCSINVSDNLDMGLSHYYAEVLRVKQVAQSVSEGKHLIVIFDELFKGTNVKDAYEATLAVTQALHRYRRCQYIISTHIVEVGEQLREQSEAISFQYMPTIMQENKPTYPYRAQNGISADKHGMLIIRNEDILKMLEKANSGYDPTHP